MYGTARFINGYVFDQSSYLVHSNIVSSFLRIWFIMYELLLYWVVSSSAYNNYVKLLLIYLAVRDLTRLLQCCFQIIVKFKLKKSWSENKITSFLMFDELCTNQTSRLRTFERGNCQRTLIPRCMGR